MASPASTTFILLLLCAPALSFSLDPSRLRSWSPLWRRQERSVPPLGFYNPNDSGGKMLTVAPGTGGLGEPLNVIVSGHSDETVLVDREQEGGFRNYWLSLNGFGAECLGQHAGLPQTANLGDGNGQKDESAVLRWNYGDPEFGTCRETIQGGNHFRYWVQNGPNGNSGAYFLTTAYEKAIEFGHDPIFNGYNLGRDWLVGNATALSERIPSGNITNGTTYSGQTSFNGYTYRTDAIYLSGILSNSTDGLNHASKVGGNGVQALDGLVAVLTVRVVSTPPAQDNNGAVSALSSPAWLVSTSAALFLASFALSLYA
ncbi:hypothetical protein C8Q76DRAFT_796910 [Earliella scabrosa]|nr:hypothetical protein C8Q76DRAFT_796910 [Earliella scabrosa]